MKIAIILSGCGNRDGSELQETLSLMLAFDRRDWQYKFFAPQGNLNVVSHLTGEEKGQRDIYEESARIARGDIQPIEAYDAVHFDALALPGGMGAARNLSTYAFDGEAMTVRTDVERAILDTYHSHKPILAMCIAPMVLARVLGSEGILLTLGKDCDASRAAVAFGCRHQCCAPTEACVDRQHRIYTTPAYMVGSRISQIFAGAEALVSAIENDLR
mgnify:CR=1 FL=1